MSYTRINGMRSTRYPFQGVGATAIESRRFRSGRRGWDQLQPTRWTQGRRKWTQGRRGLFGVGQAVISPAWDLDGMGACNCAPVGAQEPQGASTGAVVTTQVLVAGAVGLGLGYLLWRSPAS